MSEPNPQESTPPANPPAPQAHPQDPATPASGINPTLVVAGIALLLVVAMVVLVMKNMTDDGAFPDGEIITTKSGLKYVEVKVGEGQEAKAGDKVSVHYTGRLKDGTKFDSSVGKKPFDFKLGEGQVIKGWDEGVAGMKEGGKRKLIVPHELGYGERGQGSIPAFAELHFDVELLKVSDSPLTLPKGHP